jgi:hypothetical protein
MEDNMGEEEKWPAANPLAENQRGFTRLEHSGEMVVVTAPEIGAMSRNGYRMLGVYQERVPDIQYIQDNCSSGETRSMQRIVVTERTYFLMGRDEDTTLFDMACRLEAGEKRVSEVELELMEVEKLRNKIAELGNLSSVAQERADRYQGRMLRLQVVVGEFESDIAKIREAIGTREMEKILSEEGAS